MSAPAFLVPLRTRAWRRVWVTGLTSYVGTWMQVVGAQWLMGSLSHNGEYVALLQAAASLPYVLVVLPAGVLGDVGSRRILLIAGQTTMAVSAAVLGALTLAHAMSPVGLLGLTVLGGAGQALIGPAWLALLPGLLPTEDIPAGAALDGASVAMARVIGPVLGGVVIAVADPAADFFLNGALSLFSVVILLRTGAVEHERTSETFGAALRSGLLHTRRSHRLRRLVVEVAAFSVLAGSVWALLPNLARGDMRLHAAGYGILLGCAGVGATATAWFLPSLRRRLSLHQVAAIASFAYALSCGVLALRPGFVASAACVMVAGGTWVAVVASLDALAQTEVPDRMRARAMSIYEFGFQGGLGMAGVIWGVLASQTGDGTSLLIAAVALVVAGGVGLLWSERHPTVAGVPGPEL